MTETLTRPDPAQARIRLGVARCLLGDMRHHGGHKFDAFLVHGLDRFEDFVPVTMPNHSMRKYGQDCLAGRVYLDPHPMELRLRNHV